MQNAELWYRSAMYFKSSPKATQSFCILHSALFICAKSQLCNSPLQPGIPFYAKTRNNIGKTCFDKV